MNFETNYNTLTDDELIRFAENWNKISARGKKVIYYIMHLSDKTEIDDEYNFIWVGNYITLSKNIGLSNTDMKESTNFRKDILSVVNKGIIKIEKITREKIKFIVPYNWKELVAKM